VVKHVAYTIHNKALAFCNSSLEGLCLSHEVCVGKLPNVKVLHILSLDILIFEYFQQVPNQLHVEIEKGYRYWLNLDMTKYARLIRAGVLSADLAR